MKTSRLFKQRTISAGEFAQVFFLLQLKNSPAVVSLPTQVEQIENRQNGMLMMAERVFGWERGKSRQEVEGVGASALQGVTLHSVHCALHTPLHCQVAMQVCAEEKRRKHTMHTNALQTQCK